MRERAPRPHSLGLLITLAALFLWSCGSSSGTGNDTTGWEFPDSQETSTEEVADGDDLIGDIGKDGPQAEAGSECCDMFFLHDPAIPIHIPINTFFALSLKVVDFCGGGFAVDYPITFTLDPPPDEMNMGTGEESAELTTFIGYTNELGEAKVNFKSGTAVEQEYTITAWADCGQPVQQKVYVSDVPTGDLEVTLKNGTANPQTGSTAITFNTIRVALYSGNACDGLYPTQQTPSLQEYTIGSVPGPVNFLHLAAEKSFTVYAVALGPNGHLAGTGCIEDVILQPDIVNQRNLTINMLSLNPTGCYDCVNTFNFQGAIPGQVGEIIDLMVDLFYDPGTFIFDMVMKIISMYFGEIWGTIAETIINPFKAYLSDLITDWFLNNSPDWVQCFFIVGQDLTQIVAHAELIGDVCMYKVYGDTVNGEEQWHGFNINWALGCQQQGPCAGMIDFNPLEGLCDYDAEKDKCVCPVDLTEISDFPGDFVAGYFNAFISNFDQLLISNHEVQINYGKLILWVLNDLIITYVTGGQYNSIEDLLHSIIDCNALATGMIGSLLSNLGISNNQLEDFCDGAVNILVSPIEELLGALNFNTSLWLNGGCTMLDSNDDLLVDELLNGYWLGAMEIQGTTGSQFEGTFRCTRKGATP
jgi:hypothetical protein